MKRFACTLTPENYNTACDLAGTALLRRIPAASTILQITEGGAWNEFSTGVYIAADFENAIRYTGSAIREDLDYQPVQPRVVAEFLADTAVDAGRYRHPVRFLRVRSEIDPAEVTKFAGYRRSGSGGSS